MVVKKKTVKKKNTTSAKNGKKGGRPVGTANPETLERRVMLKHIRQKAMRAADVLFNSQLHLATGQTYLYKIEKKRLKGKKGEPVTYVPQKPKLVTSTWEIEEFLLNHIVNGDAEDQHDSAATYYYMTTTKGENKAIDSIQDRAYGKSAQVIVTEDDEGEHKAIEGNIITFASQDDN